MRVACWNIKTLYSKNHEIIPELNEHKIDICALSETKKQGKGITKLDNYVLMYSGVTKDKMTVSGVELLVHQKYEQNTENIEYIIDRILILRMFFEQPLHIISVYAPDTSKPEDMTTDLCESLQSELDKIPQKEKTINYIRRPKCQNRE